MPHRLLYTCTQRFIKEDRSIQAAGLTFYTLFALAPLMVLGLSLAGWVSIVPEQTAQIEALLLKHFVPEDAGAIEYYIHNFVEASTQLSHISFIIFLLTSIFMVHSIESCFNQIWRVEQDANLLHRSIHYFMVLIVSPLFVGVSVGLSAIILSLGWLQHPVLLSGLGALIKLIPFILTWFAITVLYYWLPHARVGFKYALGAGIFVAFLFEIMKHIFQLYVVLFPTYQIVYGAFALLPIFLLWVYFSWAAVLYGATLAYEMRKRHIE